MANCFGSSDNLHTVLTSMAGEMRAFLCFSVRCTARFATNDTRWRRYQSLVGCGTSWSGDILPCRRVCRTRGIGYFQIAKDQPGIVSSHIVSYRIELHGGVFVEFDMWIGDGEPKHGCCVVVFVALRFVQFLTQWNSQKLFHAFVVAHLYVRTFSFTLLCVFSLIKADIWSVHMLASVIRFYQAVVVVLCVIVVIVCVFVVCVRVFIGTHCW
jgi:hypothetical protein